MEATRRRQEQRFPYTAGVPGIVALDGHWIVRLQILDREVTNDTAESLIRLAVRACCET